MSGIPEWYVAHNGQSVGPLTLDELIQKLPQYGGAQALVYGPGVSEWKPASTVTEIAQKLSAEAVPPMPPAPGAVSMPAGGSRVSHEIDYEIHGEEMQYVEITLDLNSQRIARGDKIVEDHIDNVFVKDLYVAERIDVEFQALEFDAAFVGNVFELDDSEVGEIRERANGGELRHLELDPDLFARIFVAERIKRKKLHLLARSGANV